MKRVFFIFIIFLVIFTTACAHGIETGCLTGAFLTDQPTRNDIERFKSQYGKKPYLVMIFIDWGKFIDKKIIKDVYSENCILFVTWEPWDALKKRGIDYDKILSGEYDRYIKSFAGRLRVIKKDVFIRFGHEMNGNWYPWSGIRLGKDKFKAIYRHIKDIFDSNNVNNAKWVFSINWQDVPEQNNYMLYYPGDSYVDYIGIDGYNWGYSQSWSKWMSFEDIFSRRYTEAITNFKKPVIISEFSSASTGGNKASWIKEAMNAIKRMQDIKGFVLFNVNKEADWSFPGGSAAGEELKKQLESPYFKDKN